MNTATKPASKKIKQVEPPKAGDQIFVYRRSITNQCPWPAIVNRDASSAAAVSVTVFTDAGPMPLRSVLHHSDPRLSTSQDLRDNGCWSHERIDVK